MIETLLRPHANCLAIQLGRGGRLTGGSWFPILNLVWLFWVFSAPWLFGTFDLSRLIVTYASVPLFLWLYLRAWYGDRAQVVTNTIALTVLALVALPLTNTWSYVIYASVLLMFCTTPRRALMWLAALLTAFTVIAVLGSFPMAATIGGVLTCGAIALINLFFVVDSRKDTELRMTQQEVRRLAASAERERIGRDLHDLLGHTLSLIAIKSELADRLFERDPLAAREQVRELHQVARESLTQVRAAVTGIRATGLAAEWVSARILLESSGVALSGAAPVLELPPLVDSALALCLREAVTNVHRHARASTVVLTMQREGSTVELSIADNGRGGVEGSVFGNGLQGMRQRLEMLGGSLVVNSPRGRGTRLSLRVPVAVAEPALPAGHSESIEEQPVLTHSASCPIPANARAFEAAAAAP